MMEQGGQGRQPIQQKQRRRPSTQTLPNHLWNSCEEVNWKRRRKSNPKKAKTDSTSADSEQ
jgi:hypothetical protein